LLHTLSFRPMLVHEGNASLGYVDATHCSVSGVKTAALLATCLECGAAADSHALIPPITWSLACRTCFARMRVDIRAVRPEVAGAEGAGGAGAERMAAGAADARRKRDKRIQAGQPLPEQGTCEHYRHSYRWLRFPCCDALFPCDVCHDLASDHVHEWAKRMVCGHCAREQPYSNNPCSACGGSMSRRTAGPAARYWEGGHGQRNKALMSRKDSRKYKGTVAKTKSRKSRTHYTNE
jgi:uncharacterized CHY-type Zn-finger protein